MAVEQTKGKYKLEGIIEGLKGEGSFREGYTKNDDHYKSLSFFVRTSKTNRIRVEIFGMVRQIVKAYSNKTKKTIDVKWNNRHDDFKDYKVMGTQIVDGGRKVLVEYDAIDHILENFKDGDAVSLTGRMDYQEFESQGQKRYSTKFPFTYIKKLSGKEAEIDLETDNIVGKSSFEQEIIIDEIEKDDDENKLVVNVFTADYRGEITPTTLHVDMEEFPKLANNLARRLKFGDMMTVYGNIVNMTVVVPSSEAEEDLDEDDWGGDEDIQDEFETIESYVSELQIRSVKRGSHFPQHYNEDDLISEGKDKFEGNIDEDEDFEDDISDFDDDDELPFE
mgnify:CR=1 FL=1